MAKIDTLKAKVTKAQETVEKKKATIVRHEKQLVKKIAIVLKEVGVDLTGKTKQEVEEAQEAFRGTDDSWKFYEVKSKLEDIKGATKKLAEAERILAGHQERLQAEQEKDNFINNNIPQVIKDFLEKWKEMAFDWHVKRHESYLAFAKKLDAEAKQAEIDLGIEKYRRPTREQEKQLKEMELDYRSVQARKAQYAGAVVLQMCTYRKEEERLAYLDKLLEEDKRAKMVDLINRINHVVGEIQDATGLRISEKGNLDGIIKGTRADAKIETIGAGGYNIQCFHYRTLVHEIK
jgi:hypothetical protein